MGIFRTSAISGNPYLFDEKLGISKEIQNILDNISEANVDDFARNYLIKTDQEWKNFHHSNRTLESCRIELTSLKDLYVLNHKNIKDIFDFAVFGEDDQIFNLSVQKDFYGKRLHVIKNARHNLFFRINSYDEIFDFISD